MACSAPYCALALRSHRLITIDTHFEVHDIGWTTLLMEHVQRMSAHSCYVFRTLFTSGSRGEARHAALDL